MAGKCRVVLVLPPIAISTLIAFSMDSCVTICLGVTPSITILTNRFPDSFAIRVFLASTACAVPQPGRLNPSASVRHAIVLAVNNPAQEPAPLQDIFSILLSSESDIAPLWYAPTPSKTDMRSRYSSPTKPGSMGPPVTTIAGISSLPAAIRWPGKILSHAEIRTIPSNWCACIISSMVSSIASRLGSEYFIPS